MDATTLVKEPAVKTEQLSPEHILKIGMGFWASKTVLAAVNFKVFTLLAQRPQSALEIKNHLGLHDRAYLDFLDALVALGFLERTGLGIDAIYSNTPETDFFLDKNKLSYLGGILEMSNNRLYRFWNNLEEGLKTGKPQNELKDSNSENQFYDLYSKPESLAEFQKAMSGLQMGAFIALAKEFDFSTYSTFCDVGGGNGSLCIQIALNNQHMVCTNFELPAVEEFAKSNIKNFNLSSRIKVHSGDFFEDELPKSDVIAMGNILHDWGEEEKLLLIKKAYDALPKGGAFICIENIIDNNRDRNVLGLLMSLNMLIETKKGFDFTFNDFDQWAHLTGFTRTEWVNLVGPTSAVIAYK
jgi:precorrin-6B methylase 2